MPVISIQQLVKRYPNFTAVDHLNMEVMPGQVFGLLGPNGAGKSTTLRSILGLIYPTSGTIKIFNKNLATDRAAIMRCIGCIVEKPDFYLHLSAWSNLKMMAMLSGTGSDKKRMEEMFELVGLKGRENDPVKAYSHGMKQRLGLAQALYHEPDLVILDEPTTGLDPQGIIDLRLLIMRLRDELGKTVILSSHILSEIEIIADAMAIIYKGKAVAQGKVQDLLSNENLFVNLEPVDLSAAMIKIQSSSWALNLQEKSDKLLTLQMAKTSIPVFANWLQQEGISYYVLNYRRALEDYFLKLTSESQS